MQIQKPADLARTVKTRRQAQGLTQQDIANAVGITRQSLARIERGHGGASFDTVLRICEKLDLRLEAISTDTRHTTLPAPNRDALRTAASAIAAAATAAARNINTSTRAARWQGTLDDLNAAIEAGDPDREEPTASREFRSQETSYGSVNG